MTEPACWSRCHHGVPCDGSCTARSPEHRNWARGEHHIWIQREGLPSLPEHTACEQFTDDETTA